MPDELESLVKQMYQRGDSLSPRRLNEVQKVFVASVLRECKGEPLQSRSKIGHPSEYLDPHDLSIGIGHFCVFPLLWYGVLPPVWRLHTARQVLAHSGVFNHSLGTEWGRI